MKTRSGSRARQIAPFIPTSALQKDERITLGLCLITHGKGRYPLNGNMGGPRFGLDFSMEKDKTLVPAGIRTPDRPVPYLGSYATQKISNKNLKILWNRSVVS